MAVPPSALHHQVHTLYAEHHGRLHGWMRRRLGCGHRAADLAHDTFVRLLAREEPMALQEPRAFLTTVAQRVLGNHWRREQLERAYLEALASHPEIVAPSPEERAILLETLLEIDRLLDGLPAVVRRAFLMAQLDGRPLAEIGAELGLSLATVKRHLQRAGARCFFALR